MSPQYGLQAGRENPMMWQREGGPGGRGEGVVAGKGGVVEEEGDGGSQDAFRMLPWLGEREDVDNEGMDEDSC